MEGQFHSLIDIFKTGKGSIRKRPPLSWEKIQGHMARSLTMQKELPVLYWKKR